MNLNLSVLFLGAFAFVGSALAMPLASRMAMRWGLMDQPSRRKWHRQPTPRSGGIVIYGVVMFFAVLWLFSSSVVWKQGTAILLAGTWLWALGVADDAGRLHHQIKLWLGMPLAAIVLFLSGIRVQIFPWLWMNIAVTILWVMGIVSAFNLLDNMDGLTAGVTAIASFYFTTIAWIHGQYLVTALGALVCGSVLGFLAYNYPPASIFLGDGGALFLGLMMAALSLKVDFPVIPTSYSWIFPVLILGVPIFDTSLVTISRIRRGLIPFATPGKDHFSHRLYAWGLNARQVALVHYILSMLLGLLGVYLVLSYSLLSPWLRWGLPGFVLCAGLIGIFVLERAPYER